VNYLEIFFWLCILVILFSFVWASRSAAPWLPTRKKDVESLIRTLSPHISHGAKICDIGCGNGTIVFSLVRFRDDVYATGVEISLLPLFFAYIRWYCSPLRIRKRVKIICNDLFKVSLNEFDVVVIFLLPKAYDRIRKKLKEELNPDAQAVFEAWPLPNATPELTWKHPGGVSFFVYRVKNI